MYACTVSLSARDGLCQYVCVYCQSVCYRWTLSVRVCVCTVSLSAIDGLCQYVCVCTVSLSAVDRLCQYVCVCVCCQSVCCRWAL